MAWGYMLHIAAFQPAIKLHRVHAWDAEQGPHAVSIAQQADQQFGTGHGGLLALRFIGHRCGPLKEKRMGHKGNDWQRNGGTQQEDGNQFPELDGNF